MDRRLVALLAVACGATVANLYYAQPLLSEIAAAFGVSEATAGLLITVSQVAYAAGLVLIVPLGDLLDRRRLVARLLLVAAAALVLAAAAPGLGLLALGIGLASVTSVVVQILVPFASTLAPDSERGHVVGLVMSGLLSGILLARTVSGLIAELAGWRTPFAAAAVAMVLLALALWRALPRVPPASTLPYPRLLASVPALIRREPLLRRRMAYGACGFASFSVAWTTLAFLLSAAPFDYGEGTIGLFGLAGLAGAVGAQGFGRLHDRGHGRAAILSMQSLILLSWGLLVLGETSVPVILLTLALLDFAIQGQNVLNQGAIFGLGRELASRISTAYVTANFIGGALGSAAGSLAWSLGGWRAVCAVGAAFATVGLLFSLTERRAAGRPAGSGADGDETLPPAAESQSEFSTK